MSDLLPSFIALAHAEPALLAWQANPAHSGWQTEMSGRQAAYDALAAHVADLQPAVDSAQDAVNNFIEPEPGYFENAHGIIIETFEHKDWAKKIAPLKVALQTATKALAQAQEDKYRALKLRDDWVLVEPPSQLVVDNPDHLAWNQHIATARSALEATHWKTIYDSDLVLSQQVQQAAHTKLAAVNTQLANERIQLVQAQAQVGLLGTQVSAQAAEAEAARQTRDGKQGDVNALLQQQQNLAGQQPPTTLIQANPQYSLWQERMLPLQQALDAASAQAAGPQATVDTAQQAVVDHLADEPDPFIENNHGAQRPNPAHRTWATQHAKLQAYLDAAISAAAPSQQALAAAQAAWDAGNAAAPPPNQLVDNPAYQVWAVQTAETANALASAKTILLSASAACDSATQRLAAAQAALQAVLATVSSLPTQIATLEASLPALQLALNQANESQALQAARGAVLLGQPAPDAVLIEVFNDLFTRWSASVDAAHDFDTVALQADDERWRLQAQIDELARKIADADAAMKALSDSQTAYDNASKALDSLTREQPNPADWAI